MEVYLKINRQILTVVHHKIDTETQQTHRIRIIYHDQLDIGTEYHVELHVHNMYM